MNTDLRGQHLEGDIIRLAFGGTGIMRHEGLVIFVPFAAPGDRVRVKILKHKKNFAEAELLEVLVPSQMRRVPPCPYYGRCGGCQFQHLDYSVQVDQKRHFVEDALQRIGKITLKEPITIIGTDKPWAYRRHIRLTLFTHHESYRVGYVGVDDKELVPVTQCPIFSDIQHPIVSYVSELVTKLTYVGELRAHLSVIKDESGHYVLFLDFPDVVPVNVDQVLQHAVSEENPVRGAVWKSSDGTGSYGKTACQLTIGGLTITYSPMAFVQSHPEQSAHIYHSIEALVKEHKGKRVLDLYCGIGITSLLLTQQGVATVGVEANHEAVILARQNAEANSCSKAVFVGGDVAKVIRKLLKEDFDFVVLNPPRTGSDVYSLEAIAHAKPKHIIYISCMPPTLARDLALLCQKGYRVKLCRAYDMFPQTTHVETLVLLECETAQ